MSTIALPEFMARTSLQKPHDQVATFVPRRATSGNISAGSVQQPRYRIRFAPSDRLVTQQTARSGSAGGALRADVPRGAAHTHRSASPAVNRGAELAEVRGTARQATSNVKCGSECSQRGRFRLTRRGRLIFRGLPLLTLAALVVLGALTFAFPAQAKGSSSQPSVPVSQMITVYHGDSLWSIAEQVAPGQDSRDVVNRIMQINDLTSAQVQPGQVLEVPVYSQ